MMDFIYEKVEVPQCTSIFFSEDGLDKEQKSFYIEWVQKFEEGTYYDLGGNITYLFLLVYEVISDGNIDVMIEKLQKILDVYGDFYPKIKMHTADWLQDCYIVKGLYEKALELDDRMSLWSDKYVTLRMLCNKPITLDDVVENLLYGDLTPYGKSSLDGVKEEVKLIYKEYEQEKNINIIKTYLAGDSDDNFYSLYLFAGVPDPKFSSNVKRHQFKLQHVQKLFPNIVRDAENRYRQKNGLPKIGEGWVTETELYYLIKEVFDKYEVIQHGRPPFLGLQHLDVYIPSLNIAIEYQGEQHYNAIPIFGGESGLEKSMERDEIKRVKCAENGVKLFYAYPDYDFDDLLTEMHEYFKHNDIKVELNDAQVAYKRVGDIDFVSYKEKKILGSKKNISTKEEKIKNWIHEPIKRGRRSKKGDLELKLEIENLIDSASGYTHPLDIHACYSSLAMLYKTFREKEDYLERCIEIYEKDIELFSEYDKMYREKDFTGMQEVDFRKSLKKFKNAAYNFTLPFNYLATVYEKLYEFEKAIKVCSKALEYGILDNGSKGGFKGKLERLQKRLKKEQEK